MIAEIRYVMAYGQTSVPEGQLSMLENSMGSK